MPPAPRAMGLGPAADEKDVLPIYFLNEMEIGKGTGVDIFFRESRQEMCKSLVKDPRFLFMPSFYDQVCRPGDIGWTIRLTSMEQLSRSIRVQGVAEEPVVVEVAWVQPQSNGLHLAKIRKLDKFTKPVHPRLWYAFARHMKEDGWQDVPESPRCMFRPEEPRAHLLATHNWPDRIITLVYAQRPEELGALRQRLARCWERAQTSWQTPRERAYAITPLPLDNAVHWMPPWRPSTPFPDAFARILCLMISEGEGVPGLENMREAADRWIRIAPLEHNLLQLFFSVQGWTSLLHGLEIGCLHAFPVHMSTVALEPCVAEEGLIRESFPPFKYDCFHYALPKQEEEKKEYMAMAAIRVTNRANVRFVVGAEDLRVCSESLENTLRVLAWKMNVWRVDVLRHARLLDGADRSGGPGTTISEFLAPRPADALLKRFRPPLRGGKSP